MKITDYCIRLTTPILLGLALSGCVQQLKQSASTASVESALTEVSFEQHLPSWVQKPPQGYVLVEIALEIALETAVKTKASDRLSKAQSLAIPKARALLKQALLEATAVQIALDDQQTHLREGSLEQQTKQTIRAQVKVDLTFDLLRKAEWWDEENQHYFGLYAADPKTLKQALIEQLLVLDSQLTDYRHTTYRGSELEQLWALAPVLPTLEARRMVRKALMQQSNDLQALPELPNNYLAKLMDLQLSGLFNRLNISVDALTAETAIYEPFLVAGLHEAGFNISARRPSLIVRYYIEQYVEEAEIALVTDIELNHRNGNRFANFNDEILVNIQAGDSLEESKALTYSTLAKGLSELTLSNLYAHIKLFNAHRFGR